MEECSPIRSAVRRFTDGPPSSSASIIGVLESATDARGVEPAVVVVERVGDVFGIGEEIGERRVVTESSAASGNAVFGRKRPVKTDVWTGSVQLDGDIAARNTILSEPSSARDGVVSY
nr:hypothetical protein [Halobellus ramosii]